MLKNIFYNIVNGQAVDKLPYYNDTGFPSGLRFYFPGGDPSDLSITDDGVLLVKDQDYSLSSESPFLVLNVFSATGDVVINGTGLGTAHTITYNLSNIAVFVDIDTEFRQEVVADGTTVTINLAAYAGYSMPEDVTITIGGVLQTRFSDYTYRTTTTEAYFWERGEILLPYSTVTDDIVIGGSGVNTTPACQVPAFPLQITLEHVFFSYTAVGGKYGTTSAFCQYYDGVDILINARTDPDAFSQSDFLGLGSQSGLWFAIMPNPNCLLPSTIIATSGGQDISSQYTLYPDEINPVYGGFINQGPQTGPISIVATGINSEPEEQTLVPVMVSNGKLLVSGGKLCFFSPPQPPTNGWFEVTDAMLPDSNLTDAGISYFKFKHIVPPSGTTSKFEIQVDTDVPLESVHAYLFFTDSNTREAVGVVYEYIFKDEVTNTLHIGSEISTDLSDYPGSTGYMIFFDIEGPSGSVNFSINKNNVVHDWSPPIPGIVPGDPNIPANAQLTEYEGPDYVAGDPLAQFSNGEQFVMRLGNSESDNTIVSFRSHSTESIDNTELIIPETIDGCPVYRVGPELDINSSNELTRLRLTGWYNTLTIEDEAFTYFDITEIVIWGTIIFESQDFETIGSYSDSFWTTWNAYSGNPGTYTWNGTSWDYAPHVD